MPRQEKLSSRLETLLDAIFDVPANPMSLYWDIVDQLRPSHLVLAQKRIKKTLQARGAIGPAPAFMVAAILHLTGFPAHRVMHFLSLYVSGGIGLSQYEFAVATLFQGEPPLSASLVYDITQYTYLEKRLLARKSMEISAKLKDSLSSELMLYLYLLSLRDDLSNENAQLIALIMKSCFPALEVRTRVGGASLEEYGEIARAWKNAEKRSFAPDLSPRMDRDGGTGSGFDRDSASYFLDKYFSDPVLSQVRASAPLPVVLPRRPRQEARPEPSAVVARRPRDEQPSAAPGARAKAAARPPVRRSPAAPVVPAEPPPAAEPNITPTLRRSPSRARGAVPPAPRPRRPAPLAKPPAPSGRTPMPAWERFLGVVRGDWHWLLPRAPFAAAAVIVGSILLSIVPALLAPAPVSVPAPAPAIAAPSARADATPPPPKTTVDETYVVREGDSLWTIFLTLKSGPAREKGWADFLSRATSLNALGNPDRIRPGTVLNLTPSAR